MTNFSFRIIYPGAICNILSNEMQNGSDILDAKKWLLNKLCIDEIQTSAKDIVQKTCQRHASISNALLISKEMVFENKIDSLYTNILLDRV